MRAKLKKTVAEEDRPGWATEREIDEARFCRDFAACHPTAYAEGRFFSINGAQTEEQMRKKIYDYLSQYYATDLHRLVSGLLETMKLELRQEEFHQRETVIHVNNGTLRLDTGLSPHKEPCRCRLPVNYDPQAPRPERWLGFLEDLLEPEDIPTLQEFMGYCLVPVNYAQKMLLIVGSGGEGKSRVGVVLSRLLGEGMCNGSLTKLERDRFARADLQNRLVMVDDDLQLEALTTTGNIKTVITAEQRMDMERKGIQSYQGTMFCRLMAFGNGNLRSLHDRSHGFFRRQIILTARPRQPDRVDDPFLGQLLCRELEGILLWALEGLERLICSDMRFTVSPRAAANLEDARSEGNNTLAFLESTGYIRLDPLGEITARHLYSIYTDWCEDNTLIPLSAMSFVRAVNAESWRYGFTYSNHIPGGTGRQVRGFRGIRAMV